MQILSEGITRVLLNLWAVQLVHTEILLRTAGLLSLLSCNPEGCLSMEQNVVSPAVCASHDPSF